MGEYKTNVYNQIVDADYTTEELKNKILDFLEYYYPKSINVHTICNGIIDAAFEEKRIVGLRENCNYWDYRPSEDMKDKVFGVLHKLALEEKILYRFDNSFKIWR